jgi:hypothetical protein
VSLPLIFGPQHNHRQQEVPVLREQVLNSKIPVLNSKNTLSIAFDNGIVGTFFS